MSPEFDAFGRPISPGSGSGPSAEPTPSEPGRPTVSAGERSRPGSRTGGRSDVGGGSADPRPAGGPSPATRSGCGCAALLGVLAVLVGVGAVAVFSLAGEDAEVRGSGTSADGARRLDAAGALSPAGTRRQTQRLQAVLRPGERITSLSIRENYLSALVSTGAGRPGRSITLYTDRDPYVGSGGTATDRGVSLESLDLAGPARLIAATRRGLGPRSAAKVSYVVLDRSPVEGEPAGWAVYLEGSAPDESRWTGDIHGDHVLRGADGAPAPPAGSTGPARLPRGIAGTSLVRPANLRRAVDLVRRAAPDGSVVTGVDVRPVHVDVTTRTGYRTRRFTVDAAFGIRADTPGETTQRTGIAFSSVDTRGPERALRRIESRARNRATSRVDYVLLSLAVPGIAAQRTTWGLYLAGGSPVRRYWRATLDGRRVGEPGTPEAP